MTRLPNYQMPVLLAGDVGGTKTLLGVFGAKGPRPEPLAWRAFDTLAYRDLPSMIADFEAVRAHGPIHAACFGVAGPVVGNVGHLTNVPWRVDGAQVARAYGVPQVAILNDLEAMAHAVPVLHGQELDTLQRGSPAARGNIAVIAAGTGLGEALLHHVDGRYVPSAGEGGHADFAARNDREIAVMRALTERFGRASIEHVLSGPGLQNLHPITHRSPCVASADGEAPAAAAISTAALTKACPCCVEALEIFVDVYGAEAGNLALRCLATGGVFVGGGIAPKILPALADGRFMRAFLAKPPHVALLSAMPVHVILNEEAGLLGAAVRASFFC
jgi:glucokinase